MDDKNPNNIKDNADTPSASEELIGEDAQPETEFTAVTSETITEETIDQPITSSSAAPSSDGGDIVFTDKPKKSKAGLIIGIICGLLILGGAGGFIAAYAINNQPENILMSSIDKFINAKNISTTGTIDLDFDEDVSDIDTATFTLDAGKSTMNQTGNLSLALTMSDGTKISSVSVGETMIDDGTLYLKFDGLEKFYDEYVSPYFFSYSAYEVTDCVYTDATDSEGIDCVTTTTTDNPNNTLDYYLSNIIPEIDGKWFKVSLDDVLSSEYLSAMSSSNKKQIKDTYNCVIDIMNNKQKYSKELTDLYGKNKFITMTPGQDSYYDISFTTRSLGNFLNALPSTTLVSDFASCTNTNINTTNTSVDDEYVEDLLGQLPKISAKFDGFLSHELSALKLSSQNDLYALNANLNFTYPNSLNISAPENSTPIMDKIEELVSDLSGYEED